MEMNGTNYLIPVDAKLETDRDVNFEAVPLDQVLNAVEGARKLRARHSRRLPQQSVRSPRCGAPRRRVRSAAASPGSSPTAHARRLRGQRRRGRARRRRPEQPVRGGDPEIPADARVEINKFFRLVRDDVLTSTGRKQEPFVYGSLPSEDFFFVAK